MATRDRTPLFLELRPLPGGNPLAPLPPPTVGDHAQLLPAPDLRLHVDDAVPGWVAAVERVRDIEGQVQGRLALLRDQHVALLRPQLSADERALEREAGRQASEVKALLRDGNDVVRRLTDHSEPGGRAPSTAEPQVLHNVAVALATALHRCATDFHEQQRKYALEAERQRRRRARLAGQYADAWPEETEQRQRMLQQYYNKGFTQEQIDALLINEQLVAERHVELETIYCNVLDLHELFRDLSNLVIVQGTLLDRIDHNVAQAHHDVIYSGPIIDDAYRRARRSRLPVALLTLLALILLVGLALALKFSR